MPQNERPHHFVKANTSKTPEHRKNSSISGLSGEATRTGELEQVKQKKERSIKKTARSTSARKFFSSLRKYRTRSSSREKGSRPSSDVEESTLLHKNVKISSGVSRPEILKIYGDGLSPGTNYKSIMATTQSTAMDLVKTALERYSIPTDEASKYVLCEVVEKFNEEMTLNENEKALKGKSKSSQLKSSKFAFFV